MVIREREAYYRGLLKRGRFIREEANYREGGLLEKRRLISERKAY